MSKFLKTMGIFKTTLNMLLIIKRFYRDQQAECDGLNEKCHTQVCVLKYSLQLVALLVDVTEILGGRTLLK